MKTKTKGCVRTFLSAILLLSNINVYAQIKVEHEKPRVIIETDIGIGDGDDDASLVRFLLYADVLDIEGMIVTKSGNMHERYGDIKDGYEFMQMFLDCYEQIYPNLIKHSTGYPSADHLRRGVARFWTDEAVDLIINAVDKKDPRPLWYCNWGTHNSLGPALDKVKATRSPEEYQAFISRLRVSSLWQFGSLPDHFPNITSTYIDIGNFEHRKNKKDPYYWSWDDCTIIPWAKKNLKNFDYEKLNVKQPSSRYNFDWYRFPDFIAKGHGPLCELYNHCKEGDTPTSSLLFPVGLNHITDPNPGWGSWAGRAARVEENHAQDYEVQVEQGNFWWYKDGRDACYDNYNGSLSRDNTLLRWGMHIQNDFMARIEWCVKPFDKANHPPVVVLNKDKTINVLEMNAKPGDKVTLDAKGSTDPDGNALKYEWIYYPEPGTYGKLHNVDAITIEGSKSEKAFLRLPVDANKGETIHIILIVTDNGEPELTRYRRIIIKTI